VRTRLTEDELAERETETRCPKCGRRIDPNETTKIEIGGSRGA
jgi:hypothetical protein